MVCKSYRHLKHGNHYKQIRVLQYGLGYQLIQSQFWYELTHIAIPITFHSYYIQITRSLISSRLKADINLNKFNENRQQQSKYKASVKGTTKIRSTALL